MEGRHLVGAPYDLGGCMGRQRVEDGHVGEVALARGRKRTVERHTVGADVGAAFAEQFGRFLGTHRVAARGAVAYLVEFFERFHGFVLRGSYEKERVRNTLF